MARLSRRGFLATATATATGSAALARPAKATTREPTVLTGADVLAGQGRRSFSGRKPGVPTNPTRVLRDPPHIVASLADAGVRAPAAFRRQWRPFLLYP